MLLFKEVYPALKDELKNSEPSNERGINIVFSKNPVAIYTSQMKWVFNYSMKPLSSAP